MITPTTPLTTEGGIGSRTASSLDALRGYDRPFARISWGAIIAGAVFALATQIVFTLLGIAIGLATLDPTRGAPGNSIGIGAGLWVLISSLVSLFLGGYIAGRLGGTFNGWIHGLITWATCTLLTLMFLTTGVGRLVGTATWMARFAVQSGNQASQVQLPPALQLQLNQLLAQAQQGAAQASTEAQKKLQEAQAAARQPGEQPIERQAKEAEKQAAQTGAAGSFGAVLALVLGALAAGFGGRSGQRYPIHRDLEVVEHKTTATPSRS